MEAQQFLAEFGHIAKAPGGISQLRDLVLYLAVSGRLTDQAANETASDLLAEIHSERVRQNIAGEIRANKKIRNEKFAQPWCIPANWLWCRLGELCNFSAGRTPSRKESKYWNTGQYPWFSIADLQHGKVVRSSSETVSEIARMEVFKSAPVPAGSLLMSFKLSIGKLSILGVDAYHNEAIITIAPYYDGLKEYFFKCLNGFNLTTGNKAAIKGITLNQDSISNLLIALPPKAEISRIVAKVDSLMALCDKLEAQQQDRRNLQNNLRHSTLQAVAAASRYELQTTWTRLAGNFDQLFCVPEDVNELRKLILDLAVSGYLTQKDELDESASELLNKILSTKQKFVAEGMVARRKPVKAEELQETILPEHWESITLDEAISTIDAGWSPACLPSARDDKTKWGILKTTSVQTLRFLPHEHKELPASLEPRPQYEIHVGDILITRAGPKNRVGICCVVDEAPPRLMISDKLIRFHIVDDLIEARFVALCLSAGEPSRILERLKSGMADSQMNISQDKLRGITIPLPPKPEQVRILAKIESLMRVIDRFDQQLRSEANMAGRLAISVVSSITGITADQEEDEPVKVPQTELIAPLRLGNAPNIKAQAPLATILARQNGEMRAKDLWQRFGGEIDDFYAQLKTEVAHGWIDDPTYDLEDKSSDNPKSYPDGKYVARMVVKEQV